MALIGEDITQLGVERWYALRSEERFDPKPVEAHLSYIGSLVEILFDILPAIRGIRHESLLRAEMERNKNESTKTTSQSQNLIISPHNALVQAEESVHQDNEELSANELDTLDLVDSNIRKVKRIPLQSPLIEKSCHKLEKWSIEAAVRRDLAQQADNAEIRKVQGDISQKLGTLCAFQVNPLGS